MADPDAAPLTPPPEVVAPEEHPEAADSAAAAAAAQEEAAVGEVDHKRKLEEVGADAEANGDGEDAKRPRVDGDTDASAGGSLTPPSSISLRICLIPWRGHCYFAFKLSANPADSLVFSFGIRD